MKEGQNIWLHKEGEESVVFEYGSETYESAIENGWTHEKQAGVPAQVLEVKDEDIAIDVTKLDDEMLLAVIDDCNIEASKRGILKEVQDLDIPNNEGDLVDNSGYIASENTVTDNAIDLGNIGDSLEELDLNGLRILCVELGIEGMEKANAATCKKHIKEYANKGV